VRRFADARVFVVDGAGHRPHFELYQVVAEHVDAFLAQVWPTSRAVS
jgi:pimeloyl-ACP methyl ester carboxylesterase